MQSFWAGASNECAERGAVESGRRNRISRPSAYWLINPYAFLDKGSRLDQGALASSRSADVRQAASSAVTHAATGEVIHGPAPLRGRHHFPSTRKGNPPFLGDARSGTKAVGARDGAGRG